MARTLRLAAGLGLLARSSWLLRRTLHARDVAAASTPSARLDEWLPDAPYRDTIALWIRGRPHEIFRAIREVSLRDMPLAWAAGELRYLPARLAGTPPAPMDADRGFVPQLIDGGTLVLAEDPSRELVLGSIGKLHRVRDQRFVRLHRPEDFRAFDRPDHEKLAMSFRIVEEDPERGCLVALEHRTQPIDAGARRKFGLYWLAIRPGGAFVTMQLLRGVKRRVEREAATRARREAPSPATGGAAAWHV